MNTTKFSDILTGKNVWEYYKLYEKTQLYSEKEIKEFQIRKLKSLLFHCYHNVPYYRSIILENNIDISHIESFDVLAKFPVLTKEIIQDNYKLFTPINNKKIKGVKENQTGGTTGNILLKRTDANTRSSSWGAYKRYEDWMGISIKEKTLVLMGGHVRHISIKERLSARATNFLENSISVDIYNTNSKIIDSVINLLTKNNFGQIRSYPQFLFSVAKKLDERGLTFNVRAISTTAEPIMPEHRKLFKKVFNSEVFDQYGCGEIGGVAFECEKHKGLHITMERVIIETNELNELIITDLDNFTMPFIRYWNADQVILDDSKCSCGRNTTLIKKVMGRTCDYIICSNGEFLHWAYFWHLFFDSNIAKNHNLKKFQIIQESRENLLVRMVVDKLLKIEIEFLYNDIKARTGIFNIEILYENEIENSVNGKYRPVINRILSNKK